MKKEWSPKSQGSLERSQISISLRDRVVNEQKSQVDKNDLTYDRSNQFTSWESLDTLHLNSLRTPREKASSECGREPKIWISESVITELETSKQKLVEELKGLQQKYMVMQNSKISLITQIGGYKNEISSLKALEKIREEELYTLHSSIARVHDELNFERELNADYLMENLTMRTELKNLFNFVKQHVETLTWKPEEYVSTINELNEKIRKMKGEISTLREEVSLLNRNEDSINNVKAELIQHIYKLESEKFKLKEEVSRHSNSDLEIRSSFDYDQALKENLELKLIQQEEHIKLLKAENLRLKAKGPGFDQINPASPNYHTNSQYLNKIINENFQEVTALKEELSRKDEYIQKLKMTNDDNRAFESLMKEELERVKILHSQEIRNLVEERDTEIHKLSKEKQMLMKKMEQTSGVHKTLRQDILEKDKIIMMLMEQQKKAKEKAP